MGPKARNNRIHVNQMGKTKTNQKKENNLNCRIYVYLLKYVKVLKYSI